MGHTPHRGCHNHRREGLYEHGILDRVGTAAVVLVLAGCGDSTGATNRVAFTVVTGPTLPA